MGFLDGVPASPTPARGLSRAVTTPAAAGDVQDAHVSRAQGCARASFDFRMKSRAARQGRRACGFDFRMKSRRLRPVPGLTPHSHIPVQQAARHNARDGGGRAKQDARAEGRRACGDVQDAQVSRAQGCARATFDFWMKSRAARQGRRACGFTLIELIVILLIITVVIGLIGLNLTRDASDQVRDEAQRLALVLQAAEEEAILNGRVYVLSLARDGYTFRTPDDKGKLVAVGNDELYRTHRLPAGIEISAAAVEGASADAGRLDLVIDPSGLLPPFRVEFRAGEVSWRLEGLANGTRRSERLS